MGRVGSVGTGATGVGVGVGGGAWVKVGSVEEGREVTMSHCSVKYHQACFACFVSRLQSLCYRLWVKSCLLSQIELRWVESANNL